jgi:ankyrin repeat protein
MLWNYFRFRWAELQLARFFSKHSGKQTSEDVEDAIIKLMEEVGDPVLDKVYSQIFDMNTAAETRNRAMAIRAFQWLMCAQRSLRISELAEAATANQSETTKREVDDEHILQICSNFIVADASRIAQFAHLSVREYLEKRRGDGIEEYSQEQVHNPVAETCLSYLLDPPIPISGITDFHHGLLSYSVLFWAVHWEKSSDNRGSSSLGKLFASFISKDEVGSPLMDWLETLPRAVDVLPHAEKVLLGSRYSPWTECTLRDRLQDSFSLSTPFFAACAWGFIEVLCNSSEIPNMEWKDFKNRGKSALTVACRYGQDEVVQLLIKNGAPVTAEELGGAVESGSEVVVERLLENGADVNETDISKETALLGAVQLGNCSMARLLLKNGADTTATPPYIYTEDSGGYGLYETATPLHIAAHQGNLEMVELLLDNGADIKADYQWSKGATALHWAIRYYHEEVTKVLVEKEMGIAGTAALHWAWRKVLYAAAKDGDKEAVLRVLNKGADVNAKDEEGRTALHATGTYGKVEITQLLLDYGADVNIKDNSGRTPLHQSSSWLSPEVAQLLLEYGADIDARDDEKRTTLHKAAKDRRWALVELLVEKGADIEAKDANNKTALHEACAGWPEKVQFLLQNGAGIAAETNDGWTALHFAAEHGSEEMVDLLLKQDGINPNPRTKDGRTPLSLAVHRKEGSVVRRLLEHGGVDWDSKGENGYLWDALNYDDEAVVQQLIECGQVSVEETQSEYVYLENWKSTWDNTLLHRAACKGYVASVRWLLVKGSNVKAINSNGDTPLHRAVNVRTAWDEGRIKEIVCLLLENGADIEAKNHEDTTALHMAVGLGDKMLPIVQLLLEKRADINTRDKYGATPLMRTVICGWTKLEETSKFLLEKGADVTIQTNHGSTALHIAASVAYDDKIVRLLLQLLDYGADKAVRDNNGEIALHRRPHWCDSEGVMSLLSLSPSSS